MFARNKKNEKLDTVSVHLKGSVEGRQRPGATALRGGRRLERDLSMQPGHRGPAIELLSERAALTGDSERRGAGQRGGGGWGWLALPQGCLGSDSGSAIPSWASASSSSSEGRQHSAPECGFVFSDK